MSRVLQTTEANQINITTNAPSVPVKDFLKRLEDLEIPELKLTSRVDAILHQGRVSKINKYIISPEEEFSYKGKNFLYLCTKKGGGDERFMLKRFIKTPTNEEKKKKVYDLSEEAANELELASRLRHPNIVKTLEIIVDKKVSRAYMVMEYLKGGQIMSFDKHTKRYMSYYGRKRLPIWEIKSVLRDTLEALVYLHSINIVHRDIKHENILLTAPVSEGGVAKLVDFGISEEVEPDESGKLIVRSYHPGVKKHRIGTLVYLSKEAFTQSRYDGVKGDIWSLGITAAVMLGWKIENKDKRITEYAGMKKVKLPKGPLAWGSFKRTNYDALPLLEDMLNLDHPEERPTASECLQHDFFSKDEEDA